MDLYEYQGKQFFAGFGVTVPRGEPADTVEQAAVVASRLGYPVVVKAQVAAGGRGKAGGIRVAGDDGELREHATAMLGRQLGGRLVQRVLVEQAVDIAAEYYVSFTLDRAAQLHLVMLSARGGVDIEEVARTEPAAIARLHVNPLDGLSDDALRELVGRAGLDGAEPDDVLAVLQQLYTAYTEGDAQLVEVNPVAVTGDGRILALDAKVTTDDNAAFRHPDWEEWRSSALVDEREAMAAEKGLNYVGLAGTVGIIGNGAGLVMSTLDVVNQVGGTAANFLDVGGGAGSDVVAAALEVVNSDTNVRAILVNIFGGITRCDQVAQGVIDALGRVDLRSPIVVRLDGTNAEEGRALLAGHRSDILHSEPTMTAAARRAVELAAR
ncbi:MAG: ADP-forming succinate--CoA ligase subunit beta [Actinomycetota bacterium]|nr:ADP-forming succinate--CoA ligase subunit beta [Actinomycetota bacterium]